MRRALLLPLLALACRRGPADPTIANVPADAAVYVRVRSWEELASAFPPLRFLVRGGEGDALARETGLRLDLFDLRRPFGVGLTRDGLALVLPRKETGSKLPEPASGWEATPLEGDSIGAWKGERPAYGPLDGGELPEGLVAARLSAPRLVERLSGEIEQAVAALRAASFAFLGRSTQETPAQAVTRWKDSLRSLGTLDLGLESAGGRFEVIARLRPAERSDLGRFARAARGAPHTLAGFLSKEGVFLYAESSMDAASVESASIARLLPRIGPLPLAVLGDFGAIEREVGPLGDGRYVLAVGTAEGRLFLERITGLRDAAGYEKLLTNERFANEIEAALSGVPLLEDVVYEREAFRHAGVAVSRVRFGLREGVLPSLTIAMTEALAGSDAACCAIVGDALLAAEGTDAEARIRALIDRVRSGRLDRPALAAALGSSKSRLAGIAVDLGELPRLGGVAAPIWFGGRISAALEARDGELDIRGTAELRSPIPAGVPGLPR